MEHFIVQWGYLAVFVLTVVEAACIPIPSEVTLGVAGALASGASLSGGSEAHPLNLAVVIVLGTLGETLGASVAYAVGRFGGRPLVERFGRFVLLSHADLDRAERWFNTKGEWSVLVGRVVPLIRTFIALPAGLADMQVVRFGLLTALGSLVWVSVLAGVGFALGPQWHTITHGFSAAGYVLGGVAVAAIAGFVVHRWRHVRAEATGRARAGVGTDAVGGSR